MSHFIRFLYNLEINFLVFCETPAQEVTLEIPTSFLKNAKKVKIIQ